MLLVDMLEPHGSFSGADEKSSEELSGLAMLAASVAARPSALSDDGAATEALYAASNMQRSTRLQSVFTDFKGRPNHVTVAGPSPLGAPLVQVRSEPLASALLSDLTADTCMGYAAAVIGLQARYEAVCSAVVQHAWGPCISSIVSGKSAPVVMA